MLNINQKFILSEHLFSLRGIQQFLTNMLMGNIYTR